MTTPKNISAAYRLAREAYADFGVDAEQAIARVLSIPISLHCWQADDVRGLETPRAGIDSGGIMATGAYPGRARNGDEMRAGLDRVLTLLPGAHRFNLHAFYAETGPRPVERDELAPEHFARWLGWAQARKIGLDFNPHLFRAPAGGVGLHAVAGLRVRMRPAGLGCTSPPWTGKMRGLPRTSRPACRQRNPATNRPRRETEWHMKTEHASWRRIAPRSQERRLPGEPKIPAARRAPISASRGGGTRGGNARGRRTR